MMDEAAWQAALCQFPHCLVTIGAYSDWLQENNDPRWEAYRILVDHYQNGFPSKGPWYQAVRVRLKNHPLPLTTPMIRAIFAEAWAARPEARAEFEGGSNG